MTNRPPAPRSLAPGLPLSRRPAPRRFLITLALVVLLIAATVMTVSAEEIRIDITDERVESVSHTVGNGGISLLTTNHLGGISVAEISTFRNPHSLIWFVGEGTINLKNPYVYAETVLAEYTYGETNIGSGYLSYYLDVDGTNSYIVVVFDSWNASVIGGDTGAGYIGISYNTSDWNVESFYYIYPQHPNGPAWLQFPGTYTLNSKLSFHNVITLRNQTTETYNITVQKQFETSDITRSIIKSVNKTNPYIDVSSNQNIYLSVPIDDAPYEVATYYPPMDQWYNRSINPSTVNGDPVDPDDPAPDSGRVTVFIQNSQTGALLANANLAILASAGGTEVEIINATLPGGTATYTLQPTGGGIPNPDYYRAVATVPGYSQIIENHSFTLNGPHDVIIEMRPDTGGPLDPDRAYLEFYVRDFSANGIAGASVQCNNQIKQTNSKGYAVFEVAKNATYPYVVKKSGYVTIEGTATVADGPRYVANVVLGPGTVPTYTPTPGPGGPGATPTPDRRSNEEKGQAVINMVADNAEGIGALALVCLIMGLLKLMVKW